MQNQAGVQNLSPTSDFMTFKRVSESFKYFADRSISYVPLAAFTTHQHWAGNLHRELILLVPEKSDTTNGLLCVGVFLALRAGRAAPFPAE
jgi:hypothetical protein